MPSGRNGEPGKLNRLTQFLIEVVSTAASRKKLVAHLRTPLFRNAYYLMASWITAGLGSFAFWALASRLYSAESVGLGSAAVSAATLIAVISGLGLGVGLIRFLPAAGQRSAQMINTCLTIGSAASILVAAIFLAGLGFWTPALAFLRENSVYIACFVGVAAGWTLVQTTGWVFVAKRSASLHLIQNLIAAIVKLLLLILFASFFGGFAIFLSAGLAMIVAAVVALFFLIPRVQKGYLPFPSLTRSMINDMVRYSLVNYCADLLWLLPGLLFPLMVVNTLGAEVGAYFYVAWSIAGAVFNVPAGISSSLFAEGSHDEGRIPVDTRRSLKFTLLILVVIIPLVFLLGSRVLLLFGRAYSENAARLLWVFAVSAVPMSINQLYVTVVRVRKNMAMVIAVSAVSSCLSLGLSYPLMEALGLVGVGTGFLVGQSLVAVVALPLLLGRNHLRSPDAPAQADTTND